MEKTAQQAAAEFIATFTLIFIGAGASIMANSGNTDLVGVALAHGLALAIMVTVVGVISGGHVNPAVTASLWVTGKIETVRAVIYVAAQLLGAVVGALVLRLVVPTSMWQGANLGTPAPGPGVGNGAALIVEAVLTFFLVFTVFGVAVDERGAFSKLAGFPIGLVLTMDILMGGPLSGASMNPARWFGPALVSGTWTSSWIYILGPLAGGILGAATYWTLFLREPSDQSSDAQ